MQQSFNEQQADDLELSIVVPCFNEELGLAELVRRCNQAANLTSAMAALVLLLALIGLAVYSIYGWLYLDVTPGWTRL